MKDNLYHYRATIASVYDGDTCRVNIDLGLKTWIMDETLRLYGINAPELRGEEREEGLKSRDFLRSLIDGKSVIIETFLDKKGKYGRYLAIIWLKQEDGEWLNVNDHLVANGFAEYKEY